MINEKNMFCNFTLYGSHSKWLIGDANDLTHQLECEIKLRKDRERVVEEKKEECLLLDRENTRLLRKINGFNQTRHWWERKIEIYKE
jgi:hypothetical protein